MFPATDPYDRVERIVQLGDEFFVVGEHSSQGGIWRSTDGKSWRLAASTPTAGTINGVEIHGIARTAVGFVAVGANYAIDGASPVVWYSPDGDTWTDVTPNPNECAVLFGVAAAGPQFVAVGVVCKDDPQRGPGSDGVSFASTDGRQWQRSPASDVLVDRALEDVIWTGSEYVASGLHSTDGLSWEESGVDGQPTSRRLISANDWLVGVGSITNPAGQPLAALWVSTDGMTWATRIVGEVGSEARAIAISDRGWLVTGNWIESEGALGAAVEWRSEDGITWGGARRIMAQGLGYVDDLLAMGSTVIGIGGVQAGETTDPWPPVIMRLEY